MIEPSRCFLCKWVFAKSVQFIHCFKNVLPTLRVLQLFYVINMRNSGCRYDKWYYEHLFLFPYSILLHIFPFSQCIFCYIDLFWNSYIVIIRIVVLLSLYTTVIYGVLHVIVLSACKVIVKLEIFIF